VRSEHADNGEGDQKSSDHGLRVMCGVLPLRLLQVHRPSGEPQCIAVVGMQAKSGDFLENGSEPRHSMICSSLTPESKS